MGSLTQTDDWNDYHSMRVPAAERVPQYIKAILEKNVFVLSAGDVFELGCGSSNVLALCSKRGWKVSGIDFNQQGLENVERHISQAGGAIGMLLCEDLSGKFDVLLSFGVLEHFLAPEIYLQRITQILRHGGTVLSAIPNLSSCNAWALRKYEPEDWGGHHRHMTPSEFSAIHHAAGLSVKRKAEYYGGYDVDMLIPWQVLAKYYPLWGFKYIGTVLAMSLSPVFPERSKHINPIIYGVYEK